MIKIVFFDGNGVIYVKKKDDFTKELFSDLEKRSGYKNVKKIFRLLVIDCQKGIYSRQELFRRLLKVIGLKDDPSELEREYTTTKEENLVMNKGIDLVLKKLKNKGYKIGLISNSIHSGKEKEQWLKRMGILDYFDFVFSSTDLGFRKVNPKCPKKVLEITGFKPEEAVLVGHQYKDFVGARLIGMKTLSINKVSAGFTVSEVSQIPEVIAKI